MWLWLGGRAGWAAASAPIHLARGVKCLSAEMGVGGFVPLPVILRELGPGASEAVVRHIVAADCKVRLSRWHGGGLSRERPICMPAHQLLVLCQPEDPFE